MMLNIAAGEKIFKRRKKKKQENLGLNPAHLHGSPATALHYGATNEIRRNLSLYHSSFSLTDALAYSTTSEIMLVHF